MSVHRDTLFEAWQSEYSDLLETGKFVPERPSVPRTIEKLPESGIATVGHIYMPTVLQDDIPSIEEWKDTVDHEYDYEKSVAFDYVEEMLDEDSLDRVTSGAIRFLDTCIPNGLTELRTIGLGVTGLNQVFREANVEYGSSVSYHLAKTLMDFIDGIATNTSHELALERGAFSAWSESRYSNPVENEEWFRNHAHQFPSQHESGYKMRNHGVTAIVGQSQVDIDKTREFS
ncbi:MAG: ribonucleotide reductase, alpha subunit [Candidatus Nanosalina sp. J07AB43]|nr:MAG: ribonucleotide reductase, alpha subunit [Candidatus Nanosalina sp. J07AB43]